MKQILILLIALIALGVNNANAQKWQSKTMAYATSGDDTATNSDQILMVERLGSYGYYVNIDLAVTKVSGTVAGTAYIEVSNDGVNWDTVNNATNIDLFAVQTITDATATYRWVLGVLPGQYVRVNYNTTGTQVSAPVATVYYRREN